MKEQIGRYVFVTGCLFVLFLTGCYNWPVRNRGNIKRESMFDNMGSEMPMRDSFKLATRDDPDVAVRGMKQIERALNAKEVSMGELDQPFWYLLKDPVSTKRVKLYTFYLLSKWSARSPSSVALLYSHIRNRDEARFKNVKGERINGTLGRWSQRAIARALRPELDNIYGEGISTSDLENISLKTHQEILKEWFLTNLEFLGYSRPDNGLVVNQKAKKRAMEEEQEKEDQLRNASRNYTEGMEAETR